MRYASLNKFRYSANLKTVLFTLIIQDLYEKFHDKKKLIILTSSKTFDSSINQNIAFDCQKSRFECSNSTVKISFTTTKSNKLNIYHAFTRSFKIY